MAAQYSYGITLLRAEIGSPDEALDVLERVRTGVEEAQNVQRLRRRSSMPFWKSMPRGKGNWTKQSMSFVPLSRCT